MAQHKERAAIAFGISWEPDKSNARFGAWMKALDDVTAINQAAFDSAARDGRDTVTGLLPWSAGALPAVGVLTVLGPRPRLAEFR
ncbi:hypothetical protein ACFYUJ_32625 [Streptomyces sp. NPDC004520]|uniref:hypothetical protein n=1 Tax=Streptomyces sp. NPDC004520 TaxID=3364702 RepID=UPI0036C024E3